MSSASLAMKQSMKDGCSTITARPSSKPAILLTLSPAMDRYLLIGAESCKQLPPPSLGSRQSKARRAKRRMCSPDERSDIRDLHRCPAYRRLMRATGRHHQ